MERVPPTLLAVLARSADLGFLGGTPLDQQVEHAAGFVARLAGTGGPPPDRFLDLGSGGGLPGLVIAALLPDATGLLLDSNGRRCRFLEESVAGLGWDGRLTVACVRAEEAGHQADLRGSFTAVVARSFGPPAVVAECAAPFLEIGGVLVVSEPPPDGPEADGRRWPADGLASLGLAFQAVERDRYGYAVLHQVAACPDRYPRRTGVPAKRPLW